MGNQSGFTLVELAIVLMIIGLLVGGVLRGQELISNARVTATVKIIQSIESATLTFKDAYGAHPGDIQNPQRRLRNCTSTPCSIGGNGDNKIGTPILPAAADDASATAENRTFWVHLANAGLISNVTPAYSGTPNAQGTDFPTTPFGGFLFVSYSVHGEGAYFGARSHHFIRSSKGVGQTIIDPNNQLFPVQIAYQIDKKMDDGRPNNGSVWAQGGGSNCYEYFPGIQEAVYYVDSGKTCNLSFMTMF
jgi:prepilin-type N-terminal cleavage/methylation domain-containing protein